MLSCRLVPASPRIRTVGLALKLTLTLTPLTRSPPRGQVLSEQTGGAVSLTPLNLLQLSKFYGAATHGDETRAQQALAGLTARPWTDGELTISPRPHTRRWDDDEPRFCY